MAELLRRLKRHDERYYNFAKSVMYKHLFEACPGVNSILFLISHFQLAQQVNLIFIMFIYVNGKYYI